MKKTFLTAFAALLMAIPAVQAQKVNKSGLLSKIEKSDADIADAKKNAKASTWINRGKALYEAAVEPTKSLFVNMDAAMLKLAVGEPSATKQVTLLNVPYEAWEYPYFIAYIKDGKVVTPKSNSILPSITRRSLVYVAKEYLGLEVEERVIPFEEVKDFAECGLCGTAAVISPVGKIVDHGNEICFPSGMEDMGPITRKLYETLTGIQMGKIEAPKGWIHVIE